MKKTKRAMQAVATKKRIQEVALQLMRLHSIDEITVNQICTEANVGVGTFYHYYKTRDDIIVEVFYDMDAFFTKLYNANLNSGISAYEYIMQHCLCYASFISETGVEFSKKVFSIYNETFLNQSRPLYATLKQFLEAAKKGGAVSPQLNVNELCALCITFMRGLAYDWCLHGGDYDLKRKTIFYAEKFLESFKPLLQDTRGHPSGESTEMP